MDLAKLQQTAKAMVAPGKGILAMDESSGTIKKRFAEYKKEDTEENRRLYRQMIVTAPGLEEAVSGAILFDETLRQKVDDGTPMGEVLAKKGILPGIKVDAGTKELALHPGEKTTEGLDGLRERLAEYVTLGAKFTKWRAVYTIGQGIPSEACHKANAHALARYAALAQESGLVPMVEPEVLLDGAHDIERCAEVTARAWDVLFAELKEQGVELSGTILKASMILAGKESGPPTPPAEVAERTINGLLAHVPAELAGVVFLSGGQTCEQAAANLQAMHEGQKTPWPLTFSYARGIQGPALPIWAMAGDAAKAQSALVHRARAAGLASVGKYAPSFEEGRGY